MKAAALFLSSLTLLSATVLPAQPSFTAPAPAPVVVQDADQRRAEYVGRVDEVLAWSAARVTPPGELITDMGLIVSKLARHEDADLCSRSVIFLSSPIV